MNPMTPLCVMYMMWVVCVWCLACVLCVLCVMFGVFLALCVFCVFSFPLFLSFCFLVCFLFAFWSVGLAGTGIRAGIHLVLSIGGAFMAGLGQPGYTLVQFATSILETFWTHIIFDFRRISGLGGLGLHLSHVPCQLS
ncbi:hypothetical protein BJY00DRAFT_293879 [Aspergillus carlsbadensis]|nr:hypothetical protein BJY00DRAFT_293879 [Aspergillus carlsbadensis]